MAADPALRIHRRPARRLHPHARRLILLAAPLAVAAAGLVASSASGSAPRRIAMKDDVDSISASGSRVAVAAGTGRNLCGQALVWDASSGHVTKLKDPCSSDVSYQDLLLAGLSAIWWDYSAGNHVYCDSIYRDGKALGLCGGGADGDVYYSFAGDSTIVAVSDSSVCEGDCVDGNGNLLPDGDYGVEVGRLVGNKVVPVVKPTDFAQFLDAGNWRVAVVRPKSNLVVYDTTGKQLWSVSGVTGVSGGWITGNTVVLQQGRSVRVYSATGAGTSRPLPAGSQVQAVTGGLVLYRVHSTLRLLRLSDGRDRKLVTVKGLPAGDLTAAGAFYAVDNVVTFVPIRAALQALR